MSTDQPDQLEFVSGEEIAAEAARYLSTVEAFAAAGADPHAAARIRAARARALDRDRLAAATASAKGVLPWR